MTCGASYPSEKANNQTYTLFNNKGTSPSPQQKPNSENQTANTPKREKYQKTRNICKSLQNNLVVTLHTMYNINPV